MTRVGVSLLVALSAAAATPASADINPAPSVQCPAAQIEHNRQLILTFSSIDQSTPDGRARVLQLFNENYIQHNPDVSHLHGREGYAQALDRLIKMRVSPNYPKPELIIATCNYVVGMIKEVRKDPANPENHYDSFWFDIWRIADGKLIEHWDQQVRGLDFRWDEVIPALSSPEIKPAGFPPN